jgi:hypothetical protein
MSQYGFSGVSRWIPQHGACLLGVSTIGTYSKGQKLMRVVLASSYFASNMSATRCTLSSFSFSLGLRRCGTVALAPGVACVLPQSRTVDAHWPCFTCLENAS